MPFAQPLVDPIREFFTLRRAESTVRAYAPTQQALVVAHSEAARQRLAAGQRVTHAIPAAALLREALRHALSAAAYARNPSADPDTLDWRALLPPIPPDPLRPTAEPSDDARARAALASADPLYFDRLSPEDVSRARHALERATTMVRRGVEVRSLTNLRGTRWGRLAGSLLLLAFVAFAVVRARVMPKDIALGKPVHPSSRKHNPPDGHELVDGEIGTSFGIHTNTEDNANVVIDLLGKYWIDSVKVHNRVDGWFDDSLPLVVELSDDGTHWDEIGRRTDHFEANPPWVVNGRGKPAHFVRLRVDRKSYLALSEVEVYGNKY